MDTAEYKSVSIDYDTWETLAKWSEEECRTVGGQIRFLVKQHSPKEPIPSPKTTLYSEEIQVKPTQRKIKRNTESVAEDGWAQKRCSAKRVYIKNTQRYIVMDLLKEYEGPMTNKEIHALVPKVGRLTRTHSLEAVQKITAAMYSAGLVKRRRSLIRTENSDRFQYLLSVSSHRILKIRDQKRKKAGWVHPGPPEDLAILKDDVAQPVPRSTKDLLQLGN